MIGGCSPWSPVKSRQERQLPCIRYGASESDFTYLDCTLNPFFRYVFPAEPRDGVIDLTDDEKPFYYNPYSGELSLDFPKAERRLKGGILAYVFVLSAMYLGSSSFPETVSSKKLRCSYADSRTILFQ